MKRITVCVLSFLYSCDGVLRWDRARCAPDADQLVPEGVAEDIGRFPWMGVVQHDFVLGGQQRFAVTSGVLIHPSYAIAPADDMARIKKELLKNTTRFVMWYSSSVKYTLDVVDYTLHPEFVSGKTQASIALLELDTFGLIGAADINKPVLPVCLNLEGATVFEDLYGVKMTDIRGEIVKEVYKMKFVTDRDCEEFYYQAKLTYPMMKPSSFVCGASELLKESCVWDSGVALVTRQAWSYWKLIGFSVRGPGCGAPARFIFILSYLDWIDSIISMVNMLDDSGEGLHKVFFRRISPVEIHMFRGDVTFEKQQGECRRDERGTVVFKDLSSIGVNKHFAQAFFTMSVIRIVHFTCIMINIQSMSRSNAAVWLEHHCHRDVAGLAGDQTDGPDLRKLECFVYFKSEAFVQFRINFSFHAKIEVVLYGRYERPPHVANPSKTRQTEVTDDWRPTSEYLRFKTFNPFYISMFNL